MSGHDPSPGRNRLPSTDALPAPGGIRHVTEEEVLATYVLQMIGPRDPAYGYFIAPESLRETEENLTDLLPEGYSVRISEWDAEEETPNE